MRSKDNPNLVADIKWDDLKYVLDKEYTQSIKDICKALKCDRSWVNRYVKPHLKYIYLAPYYKARLMKNEQTWFSGGEFEQLIREHLTATRQTLIVPLEVLIEDGKMKNFIEEYIADIDYYAIDSYAERIEAEEIRKKILDKCLSEAGREIYEKRLKSYTKRSKIPHVPVNLPVFDMMDMMAVHDMMDYGDVAETYYRSLFGNGAVRLELNLPDKDGVKSQKIYYVYDPVDFGITDPYGTITIPYTDYLKCDELIAIATNLKKNKALL